MTTRVSRRDFTKMGVATTAFGLAALQTSTSQARILGANDRVRCGYIGIANRGGQLLKAFDEHKDHEVAALCDVDQKTLEKVTQQYEGKPFATADFRKLIDRSDLDAVVIATPDHWHAIQTIMACKSGKDVYVEKPLSITVHEGRKMVDAARKYERVVQVGTHRRSSPLCQKLADEGVELKIGPTTVSRCYRASNMYPNGIGKASNGTPPEGFDWDMWLGPRPERPFQATIAPYKFRWWDLYSSQTGNWGVHFLDVIRWMLNELGPTSVCAMGGRFAIDDDRTVPDTLEVCYQFGQRRLAIFGQYETSGNPTMGCDDKYRDLGEVEFRGVNGTLYLSERKCLVKPERGGQFQTRDARMNPEESDPALGKSNHELTSLHARNFLDCIKSRDLPNGDIEIGHRSTTMSLIGNISLALGQRLDWDTEKERFTNSETANSLLHYEYRKPWTLEI